ncbi:aminoacyl-tRNA hydrolase [Candidatus Babeliales bacterium]|nr:aminoacyl-tRNA hydrolase [Candidatus Babeliales bacterium]
MIEKEKKIRVVIGLGNPGDKYIRNRHNIGFRVLDVLSEKLNVFWKTSDLMDLTEAIIDEARVLLIKPLTYMNNSGKIIPFLLKKGIKSEEILVVHDELEKKFANLSIKLGGSARGHNGLRSIIDVLGKDFWRLRFGIGRPESLSVSDYVLSNFSQDEEIQVPELIEKSVELILKNS